jgi:hypothetical protein
MLISSAVTPSIVFRLASNNLVLKAVSDLPVGMTIKAGSSITVTGPNNK